MKSNTPLVDAMIMFMREFKVLASAKSVDGLRSLLKQEQLEQYGDSVTPDYVYDVIRKLPRFASMRVSQEIVLFDAAMADDDPARTPAGRRRVSGLFA